MANTLSIVPKLYFMSSLHQEEEKCSYDNLMNISKRCVDAEMPDDVECYSKIVPMELSTFVIFWCSLNSVVGAVGNLLTLVAIPYATYRKR